MTVREMQMAFDTRIQLVSDAEIIKTKPDSFTILQFLNRAQEKYITENYLSRGSLQDNIEFIQKRSGALRYIITRAESRIDPLLELYDGGMEVTLPTDFLYYIKSYSKMTNTLADATIAEWSANRVINHDELDRVTNGVFHRPILREPCIVFEEDNIILYKDMDTELSAEDPNFYMIYLRQPKTMVLEDPDNDEVTTCELDDFIHNDIVELAVQMYIVDYKYRLGANAQAQQQGK